MFLNVSPTKYYTFSDEELDGCIEGRGLQFQSRGNLKWSKVVKASYLSLMDDERRFDFMRLPPELRKMVYVKLLAMHCIHEGNQRVPAVYKCWPQILAASSVINTEANGILWSINNIEIRITVDRLPWLPAAVCRLNGTQIDFKGITHIDQTLGLVEWPGSHKMLRKALMQARQLHLVLKMPDTIIYSELRKDECLHQMNDMLFALTTLIGTENRFEEVMVSIDYNEEPLSVEDMLLVLAPLRRVSGIPEVTFQAHNESVFGDTMPVLISRWNSFNDKSAPSLIASKQEWSDIIQEARGRYHQLQSIPVAHVCVLQQRGKRVPIPFKEYARILHKLEKVIGNPLEPWEENTNGHERRYGWWGAAFEHVMHIRLLEIRTLLEKSDSLILIWQQAKVQSQETSQ